MTQEQQIDEEWEAWKADFHKANARDIRRIRWGCLIVSALIVISLCLQLAR